MSSTRSPFVSRFPHALVRHLDYVTGPPEAERRVLDPHDFGARKFGVVQCSLLGLDIDVLTSGSGQDTFGRSEE